MSTILFLVRHANTFEQGEQPYWVGAQQDLALSNSGRAQLPALKRRVLARLEVENYTPARLITSPLKRARETADIFEIPVQIDQRLRELDFAAWANKTDKEILALGSKAEAELRAWRETSKLPESWALDETALHTELSQFLNDQRSKSPNTTIAVTSNGILKLIGKILQGPGAWNVQTANFCELELIAESWRINGWNQ